MGKLDGKVAVITGATSGMALASAKLFVDEGAHVFITGRRQDALDEAVEFVGGNVTGVQGDAANLGDLDKLFETVKAEKGSIDVLYANAGNGRGSPSSARLPRSSFDQTFGLNARGTLFTVQKALPLLNDGASIILTASIASIKGWPGWSVYAGSKAILHAYARVWVSELKDKQIRVNVLSPGQVLTPMDGASARSRHEEAIRGSDPAGRDRPTRRVGEGRTLSCVRGLQLRQRPVVERRRRRRRDLVSVTQRVRAQLVLRGIDDTA